jgi:hypothetical protein
MTIDAFDPLATGRAPIRNPASAVVRWEPRVIARASAATDYVEALFLGCAVTAVASVLPLVMFLHR